MSFVTVTEEHVFNYPSLLVKEIHKQLITEIPGLECPLVLSGAYYAFNMAYPKGLSSLFTIRSHALWTKSWKTSKSSVRCCNSFTVRLDWYCMMHVYVIAKCICTTIKVQCFTATICLSWFVLFTWSFTKNDTTDWTFEFWQNNSVAK